MKWWNKLRRQVLGERRKGKRRSTVERRSGYDRRLWDGGGPGGELRVMVRRLGCERRNLVRRDFDLENLAPVHPDNFGRPRGPIEWDPLAAKRRGH